MSLCGLKRPEPASRLLEWQGIPLTHLGRSPFDPRILSDLVAPARNMDHSVMQGVELVDRILDGCAESTYKTGLSARS